MAAYKKAPHFCGAPSDLGRIQTCNLLIRSQVLYSVELRGLLKQGCKYIHPDLLKSIGF